MMHLLSALPFSSDWLTTSNVQIILGVLIVLIGLAVGFRDLLRFSLMRTWAISSVTFAESIRKRVLWVTLLAMLGVVAVSQFTRPNDPQDAIRQTVKFSLMATGLVVSLVALILASTNLQREIENRVIFTIVTKPTTRLEIIFGKIVGMARVMGLILLIMGVFTWGYTTLRAWNLEKGIKASLAANEVPAVSKPTFQHYADVGLLAARSLAVSNDVQIFSKIPTGNTRTLLGDSEQGMIIPFFLDKADFVAPGQQTVMDGSVGVIQLKIDYKTVDAAAATRGTDLLQEMGITPSGPTTQASPTAPGPAMGFTPAHVQIQILNQNQGAIFSSNDLGGGAKGFLLPPAYANSPLNVQINPEQMARLEQLPGFFVLVTFATPGTEYTVDLGDKPDETPVRMLVVGGVSGDSKEVFPTLPPNLGITGHVLRFTGRMSSSGMQLRGAPEDEPVAVFNFKDAQPKLLRDGRVPFELHTMVERSGGDASLDSDDITQVTVAALDRKTGTLSEAVTVQPESSRAAYFSLPRELVGNGDFELVVRNHTTGHWLGLRPASLAMVTADEGFVFNLFKSLVVLWLLAILVSTIALFCSTFVSWPIAIVLSIVILLGHWGVQQIGDTGTGLSRQMVTDMGLKAAEAKVVSTTMDALNKLLNVVSAVLPDISKYSGGDKLEEGVAVPLSAWRDAAKVTFGYGLPLAVLAFVFLKKKEVAP